MCFVVAGSAVDTIKIKLQQEAEAIRAEDAAACRSIGEWGLSVLQPEWGC